LATRQNVKTSRPNSKGGIERIIDVLDKYSSSCKVRRVTSLQKAATHPPRSRAEEIIAAAIPIFLRFGYKKTSMDSIASAAQLSRQALYLHFPTKDSLFEAVVEQLCHSTAEVTRDALWRSGLTVDQQLLAAFADVTPGGSLELLNELVVTARAVVPHAVVNIDALIVEEVASRLRHALGRRRWPVSGSTVDQAALCLQACSYGLKDCVADRDEYLNGMRAAIAVVLTAAGIRSTTTTTPTSKGQAK
jgi:AcrR family transcriptional regulator